MKKYIYLFGQKRSLFSVNSTMLAHKQIRLMFGNSAPSLISFSKNTETEAYMLEKEVKKINKEGRKYFDKKFVKKLFILLKIILLLICIER